MRRLEVLRVNDSLLPPRFAKQTMPFPEGISIIPKVFLLLILQVLQGLRLHVDGEVPALVAADGDPVEAHLPTMQVAVDTDVGVGDVVFHEVPTRREINLPFRRDADVAVEADGMHKTIGGYAHEGSICNRGSISQVVA